MKSTGWMMAWRVFREKPSSILGRNEIRLETLL